MNLPNKLTLSRIGMTFVMVALAAVPASVDERLGEGAHLWVWRACYVLAVIAGFTDFFDGYLARKLNLITDFGKLMDPLGDKIYTMACFIILTWHKGPTGESIIPGWITILILAREFAVTGLRTLAAKNGEVIAAKDIGKLKTALQMLAMAFGGCFWVRWIGMDGVTYRFVWPAILYGIVILTAYSGVEYFWKSRHLYMRDV